jgi:thiamine biosynthesis lipoprotein
MTATATLLPGTRHVEHCMGTAFSIDIRDRGSWTEAVSDVVALLHRVDELFSTYRPGSELSRVRNGELRLGDAHPDLRSIFGLCARLQDETAGYFTARWRDGIDPTGVVKGWAIERASLLLRSYGSHNHGVNGGGDLQLAGEPEPGRPWQVAITDPLAQGAALAVVPGRDLAVATSGTAERGNHIVNPFTGRPPTGLASVTVVGASLTRVDAYATAAFARGAHAIAWLEAMPGYEGLAVSSEGEVTTTSRWPVMA